MLSKDTVPQERFKEENIKAEEAIASQNLTEAARLLVTVVEKDPENSRAFNNMGIICWTQKKWDDAYSMFLKSVSLRPDYCDALVNLFDAALKLRRINETASYFEKACLLNPGGDWCRNGSFHQRDWYLRLFAADHRTAEGNR